MADNQQTQAKPSAQPVKKRRFFRPKPKATAPAKNISKPQIKSKNPPKPRIEQNKQYQQPKPKATMKLVIQQQKATPKASPRPKPAMPKPAPKAMAKTNSTFKAHKPKGTPKQRLSDINFKYLDTPEFKDIYALVNKAQGYFATDKETCCAKFRIANEAIIERLIKDLQLAETVARKELSTNYFEQINMLSKEIPQDIVDSNVFAEMHNIRMIGNSFAHGDNKYDADRGSKTCLIAMEKICQWLVVFEPKYLSYQRAKDLTKGNFFADIWNGILSIFKSKQHKSPSIVSARAFLILYFFNTLDEISLLAEL